uniref:U118-Liphistoxin-Lth1a_1 n=1 Tax=Liphistius thaleban TaxID=1905330 RepID=A0A4Q8K634_9ARAC
MWTAIAFILVASITAAPTSEDIDEDIEEDIVDDIEEVLCRDFPCNKYPCPNTRDCEFGIVRDVCECCDTCAKGPGDQCGGLFNHAGTCREDLQCSPHPKYNQLPGQCEFR